MAKNIFRWDSQNRFFEMFNPKTGDYVRSDEHDAQNNPIKNKNPFMRSFPMLLDIGIMGHCINAERGLCCNAGIDCYQSGNKIKKNHMSVEDYTEIMRQAKEGGTFQVAIGGRGDPNKHPNFREILEITRNHGIVPNYTTSGLELTDEEIAATKELCGAVAVSQQRGEHTESALKRFIAAGCKTNIHYVLGKHTLDEAINILETNDVPEGLNAIVFLLYKPVGNGVDERVITVDDPRLDRFCSLLNKPRNFKIGFDSCACVLLTLKCQDTINMMSIDCCEASKFSAFVTSDMIFLPCSFDQKLKWGVPLNGEGAKTIQEAWNSAQFENFRDRMRGSCPSCSLRSECYGGCPIVRSIVLCNRPERVHNNDHIEVK
jgi:radical SAM protein with 4Fe4S-binding SPASM domain